MNIHYTRQRGTTLVVALIFLLILTILGVTSVSNSILQQKMSGNMRDQAVAFEAAEAAVRTGESWIDKLMDKPLALASNPAGLNNVWQTGVLGNLGYNNLSWWTTNGIDYAVATTGGETIKQANTQPRYVIEESAFIPDEFNVGNKPPTGRHYYRVTGYGVGATLTAQATVQSTFVKRYR